MRRKATRLRPTIIDPFSGMRNIGPAARADLAVLGIDSIEALAASDPLQLYSLLQVKTARKHDPCVWDVFAAAIHQARTGEPRAWWTFTQERKVRHATVAAISINRGFAPLQGDTWQCLGIHSKAKSGKQQLRAVIEDLQSHLSTDSKYPSLAGSPA